MVIAGLALVLSRRMGLKASRAMEVESAARKADLDSAQRIAGFGGWSGEIGGGGARWSDEQYRIFGYQPQEIPATLELFENAIHPDDKERVLVAKRQALDGLKPYHVEFRIVRPNGEIRWIESRADIHRNAEGQAERMVGSCRAG